MNGKVRQFVDTNVLVYAHDASAGAKHQRAATLIEELWKTGNGCLSLQVLQEFYVAVVQKVAKPLQPEAASGIISDLSHWDLHVPHINDVLMAIAIHQRFKLSFWDAMIIQSAKKLGCEVIWSEDFTAGQSYNGVKVLNPF